MTRFWLAFTVEPQKEFAAQALMRQRGIRAFVPIISREKRPRRGVAALAMELTPVLPGYVFVEFHVWQKERYHVAKETKFVWGVLMATDAEDAKPARISHDAMLDFLISLAKPRPKAPQFELCKGAEYSVKKGKFAEMNVMMLFVGQTRSTIQVHIFGSPRKAVIDNSLLQAPIVASTKVAAKDRKHLQQAANQSRQKSGRSAPSSGAL